MSMENEFQLLGEELSGEEEEVETVVGKEKTVTEPEAVFHPLFDRWGFWYHSHQNFAKNTTAAAKQDTWFSDLQQIGLVTTVEQFWGYLRYMVLPSALEFNTNYHFFREGIRPEWEDPHNIGGGRWVIFVKQDRRNLDSYWENILMALAGESLGLGELVNGAVLNRRKHMDKIALWTKPADQSQLEDLGEEIRQIVSEGCVNPVSFKMEFSLHPQA